MQKLSSLLHNNGQLPRLVILELQQLFIRQRDCTWPQRLTLIEPFCEGQLPCLGCLSQALAQLDALLPNECKVGGGRSASRHAAATERVQVHHAVLAEPARKEGAKRTVPKLVRLHVRDPGAISHEIPHAA